MLKEIRKNKDCKLICLANQRDGKLICLPNQKKGVSLMISYVILIAIVLFLSILLYIWLKTASNITPVIDCKDDTSIVLDDYQCLGDIKLNLKNNGYFNIDGIILGVGNDTKQAPRTYLLSGNFQDAIGGRYTFTPSLKPGESREAKFLAKTNQGMVSFSNITVIQIQPFILDKNQMVICSKAVFKQNIENCPIA